MKWRLLDTGYLDGYTNMAVDEAVMVMHSRGAVPPTLRFYRWDPPTMTVGYFQDTGREIDLPACRERGVQVVRRLTGGRAVLHHQETTYSIVAREDHPVVTGSVLESYLRLSQGLLAGLKSLGVPAELSRGTPKQGDSAACFDAPSWYELVAGGKKLVGSAQTRRGGCVLQHGSIPLEMDAGMLFECLRFDNPAVRDRLKRSFAHQATSLTEVLERDVTHDEAASALAKGFAEALGIKLVPGFLTAEEMSLATELKQAKYATEAWNLTPRRRHSPTAASPQD
ncbi:hypothetical protein SY88_20780 [Clostridiales bacterium PH28_bin88]|nr:hypothetical protein SY88_20780 [Clostridiales bacterium PH28_bin88]